MKELERVDQPVEPKHINVVILSGLASQYDGEVLMLESSSDRPTREWIGGTMINQCECLELEEPGTRAKALALVRRSGRSLNPAATCIFCLQTGHIATTC